MRQPLLVAKNWPACKTSIDRDGINLVIATLPDGSNRSDARAIARALLLEIAQNLSTETSVRLIEGRHGPQLSDPRWQVSLSYAGNRLLIGIACHQCVGVDIVKVEAIPDIEALAQLYLPAAACTARVPFQADQFALSWAQMEACCKASRLPLAEINTARELAYARCHLIECKQIEGYRIAVATQPTPLRLT